MSLSAANERKLAEQVAEQRDQGEGPGVVDMAARRGDGEWTPVTDPADRASVPGFEIRRHRSGRLALWKLADKDDPAGRVSGAIWLRGMARAASGLGWCNVVDLVTHDGAVHRWLMPRAHLAGESSLLLRELLDRGLSMAQGKAAREALLRYVAAEPDGRDTLVRSTGWHGESFVLPTRTVGEGRYLLADAPAVALPSGTLEEWTARVAAPAAGNSRLVFAMSTALASPLLKIAAVESGGVHFIGASSIGKSTAALAARSVWGSGLQSWRSTDNGLEGIAARHSDTGLVLDEIGQVDGRMVGEMAYMLANGTGKTRAHRDGTDRTPHAWRLLFLSTGEKSLAAHMADSGKSAKAGQELRLVNVEADAGKGAGLFENTHGASPQRFADALSDAATLHHGTAGPAFVEAIVGHDAAVREYIDDVRVRFDAELRLGEADGQVRRVATRFALIAAAGEIATEKGLTGWTIGESITAAQACFRSWRASWAPAGTREAETALEQVVAFIQQHASRFETAAKESPESLTHNRAGFLARGEPDEYLIFPNVFRDEVCQGLRVEQVTDALIEHGHLTPDKEGKRQVRRRAGGSQQRFYIVRGTILEGAGGG